MHSQDINSSTVKTDTHVSHCRVASLQYSCLESIENILNMIASISNLKESQSTIQSYLFEVNRTAVKDSTRIPSSYSNILMNYLLSSKRTNENLIQLIVTLGSSFLLNKLVVPRDFSNPRLLEPIFQQFQLQSVDFSYCQFLDNTLVNLLVQCMTHHTQPLRKLALRGTMFTQINALNPLTRLECLDISELNYLQPIPDCKSVQDYIQYFCKTFPQLTILNIYSTNLSSHCWRPRRGKSVKIAPLLSTDNDMSIAERGCSPTIHELPTAMSHSFLVHLDLSGSQSHSTSPWTADQVHRFFHNLSTISTLQYLDVSFWPVKIEDFRSFQQRNTMLSFLGLLGTDIVSNTMLSTITSEFTSACDETSIINSIHQYADRRDYINYIVNCLIEDVDRDTHQFEHPDQLTNVLLDIIEDSYLYNKTSLPLPIHMPTFVDITYIISRILDKVFLEHLATHTVKRIVFVLNNMLKIANVNISCNNELLIDIFMVLSNFIVPEYISFLETFINDVYHLVFQLLNKFSSWSNSRENNLLEVSTLVLSHFSWKHSQNNDSMSLLHFVFPLSGVISAMLTSSNEMNPTLGCLAVILSNLFRYRSKELRHLLSDQLCNVHILAQKSASTVVVENISKCFEYDMESFFISNNIIGDVRKLHKIVKYAFSSLSTEALDSRTVYSLCATIVYYWCGIERMILQSPITEKEAMVLLARVKLCEIQYSITDKNLLRSVTELMQLLFNKSVVKPNIKVKERDREKTMYKIIPYTKSHKNMYNQVEKKEKERKESRIPFIRKTIQRDTTIYINIQQTNYYQHIIQMTFESVMQPPHLQQQQKEMNSLIDVPLQKGEYRYLIDIRWFKQWEYHVGHHNYYMSKARGIDPSSRPGPIDNTRLLLDQGKLRRDVVDNRSYKLVSEKAWNKLLSWYGIGIDSMGIRRQVVEYGIAKQCKVDIYPFELNVCLYLNKGDYQIVTISRHETIHTLDKLIREVFSIKSTKHTEYKRVYKMINRYTRDLEKEVSIAINSSYELITDMNLEVQSAGVFDGQAILLEIQNADGTWPM